MRIVDLQMHFVEVCEAAVRACAPFIGSGKKEEGDGMAVDAMRTRLNQTPIRGEVVIGEGAKDEAPMLYDGEQVGTGEGPEVDLAVDPIEGTNLFARNMPGSICTIAAAPKGAMYRPGPCFYMDKQVYPAAARGKIDPEAPVADRIRMLAGALGKDVREICIFVLDKPRHKGLVQEIYAAGARVRLASDGDVNGAVQAMLGAGVDALFGIGGTPEGIVTACAARALGAEMFGRMAPQKDYEIENCKRAGVDTETILTRDELVKSDDVLFIATGLTTGEYVQGVQIERVGDARWMTTETVVLAPGGVVRRVRTRAQA
ncbi:MAG: class II fructose-bisphosphatase [Zetaproteobacteria bacterium]|nr:MAG: class II fructose-bisphosphatase [Zetaproteobacteria bacterium]